MVLDYIPEEEYTQLKKRKKPVEDKTWRAAQQQLAASYGAPAYGAPAPAPLAEEEFDPGVLFGAGPIAPAAPVAPSAPVAPADVSGFAPFATLAPEAPYTPGAAPPIPGAAAPQAPEVPSVAADTGRRTIQALSDIAGPAMFDPSTSTRLSRKLAADMSSSSSPNWGDAWRAGLGASKGDLEPVVNYWEKIRGDIAPSPLSNLEPVGPQPEAAYPLAPPPPAPTPFIGQGAGAGIPPSPAPGPAFTLPEYKPYEPTMRTSAPPPVLPEVVPPYQPPHPPMREFIGPREPDIPMWRSSGARTDPWGEAQAMMQQGRIALAKVPGVYKPIPEPLPTPEPPPPSEPTGYVPRELPPVTVPGGITTATLPGIVPTGEVDRPLSLNRTLEVTASAVFRALNIMDREWIGSLLKIADLINENSPRHDLAWYSHLASGTEPELRERLSKVYDEAISNSLGPDMDMASLTQAFLPGRTERRVAGQIMDVINNTVTLSFQGAHFLRALNEAPPEEREAMKQAYKVANLDRWEEETENPGFVMALYLSNPVGWSVATDPWKITQLAKSTVRSLPRAAELVKEAAPVVARGLAGEAAAAPIAYAEAVKGLATTGGAAARAVAREAAAAPGAYASVVKEAAPAVGRVAEAGAEAVGRAVPAVREAIVAGERGGLGWGRTPILARDLNPPATALPTPSSVTNRFKAGELTSREATIAREFFTTGKLPDNKLYDAVERRVVDKSSVRPKYVEYMRIKLPNGEEAIVASVDPRAKIVTVGVMYRGPLDVIAIRELLQNAADATRYTGRKADIKMDVSSSGRALTISDNGDGMLPDVVAGPLVDLYSTYKPGGPSSGGMGIGLNAVFGNSDSFKVSTTAVDPATGKTLNTVLIGDRHKWLATTEDLAKTPRLAMKPVVTEVPTGTPTGTVIDVILAISASRDPTRALNWTQDFVNTHRLQADVALSWGGRPLRDLSQGVQLVKTVDVPGARLHVYISTATQETDNPGVIYLNYGLPQVKSNVKISRSAKLPRNVVVDVESKVGPDSADYPWTPDRESLRDVASQRVEQYIQNELAPDYIKRETDSIVDAYNSGPALWGEKVKTVVRVVDSANEIPVDLVTEISKAQYVYDLAYELDRGLSKMKDYLSKLGVPHRNVRFGGIGLGREYVGMEVPGSALNAANDIILINPYNAWREIGYLPNIDNLSLPETRALLSRRITSTLVHELTHLKERAHEVEFAGQQTRVGGYVLPMQNALSLTLDGVLSKKGAFDDLKRHTKNLTDIWDVSDREDILGRVGSSDIPEPRLPRGDQGDIARGQEPGSGLEENIPVEAGPETAGLGTTAPHEGGIPRPGGGIRIGEAGLTPERAAELRKIGDDPNAQAAAQEAWREEVARKLEGLTPEQRAAYEEQFGAEPRAEAARTTITGGTPEANADLMQRMADTKAKQAAGQAAIDYGKRKADEAIANGITDINELMEINRRAVIDHLGGNVPPETTQPLLAAPKPTPAAEAKPTPVPPTVTAERATAKWTPDQDEALDATRQAQTSGDIAGYRILTNGKSAIAETVDDSGEVTRQIVLRNGNTFKADAPYGNWSVVEEAGDVSKIPAVAKPANVSKIPAIAAKPAAPVAKPATVAAGAPPTGAPAAKAPSAKAGAPTAKAGVPAALPPTSGATGPGMGIGYNGEPNWYPWIAPSSEALKWLNRPSKIRATRDWVRNSLGEGWAGFYDRVGITKKTPATNALLIYQSVMDTWSNGLVGAKARLMSKGTSRELFGTTNEGLVSVAKRGSGYKDWVPILDVMEQYKKYDLTPQQLEWVTIGRKLIEDAKIRMRQNKIPFPSTPTAFEGEYWPRKVMGKQMDDGTWLMAEVDPKASPLSPGKEPFDKRRVFATADDAFANGFRYLDPEESLEAFMQGVGRKIAMKQTTDYIKAVFPHKWKAHVGFTETTLPMFPTKPIIVKPADSEEFIAMMKQVFPRGDPNVAQLRELLGIAKEPLPGIKRPGMPSELARPQAEVLGAHLKQFTVDVATKVKWPAAIMRSMITNVDISAPMLQLLVVASMEPKIFAKAVWEGSKAILSEASYNKIMAELADYSRDGARYHLITVPSEFGEIAQAPIIGPVMKPFARGYDAYLNIARIKSWQATRHMARNKRDLYELAAFWNNATGVANMSLKGISQNQQAVMTALMFAKNYRYATIGLLSDSFKGGIRANLARESLSRIIIAGMAGFVGINYLLGQNPLAEGTLDASYSSRWMTVRIGDTRVALGGAIPGYFRLTQQLFLSSVIKGEPLEGAKLLASHLRSISSPPVGKGIDYMLGHDPGGRAMSSLDAWQQIPALLISSLMFSWAQEAAMDALTGSGVSWDDLVVAGTQWTGARAAELSPAAVREETETRAIESVLQGWKTGGLRYADLEPATIEASRYLMFKISQGHPEIDEAARAAAEAYAERGSLYHQFRVAYTTQVDSLRSEIEKAERLFNGELEPGEERKSGDWYRAAIGDVERRIAMTRKDLLRDNPQWKQAVEEMESRIAKTKGMSALKEVSMWLTNINKQIKGKPNLSEEDINAVLGSDVTPEDRFITAWHLLTEMNIERYPGIGRYPGEGAGETIEFGIGDVEELMRERDALKAFYMRIYPGRGKEIVDGAMEYINRNKDPEYVKALEQFSAYMKLPKYDHLNNEQADMADEVRQYISQLASSGTDSITSKFMAGKKYSEKAVMLYEASNKYGMSLQRQAFRVNPARSGLMHKFFSEVPGVIDLPSEMEELRRQGKLPPAVPVSPVAPTPVPTPARPLLPTSRGTGVLPSRK